MRTSIKTLSDITHGKGVKEWQRHMAQRFSAPIHFEAEGEVRARVNHGRWIADCPFCAGAEFVEPGEGFYCLSCHMEDSGGHLMSVVFPQNQVAIEQALRDRLPSHQNWDGESIAELQKENQEHA